MQSKLKKTRPTSSGEAGKASAGKSSSSKSSSQRGLDSKTGVNTILQRLELQFEALRPHQTLALERGAREKKLTVTIKSGANDNRGGKSSPTRPASETPLERLRRYCAPDSTRCGRSI